MARQTRIGNPGRLLKNYFARRSDSLGLNVIARRRTAARRSGICALFEYLRRLTYKFSFGLKPPSGLRRYARNDDFGVFQQPAGSAKPAAGGTFFCAALLFLWSGGLLLPAAGHAAPPIDPQTGEMPGLFDSFSPHGDIRRFAGETLYFDISFLWFNNAANSKISFLEDNGQYYCVLEAHTKGFVGWFTGYRKHVYKAFFDVIDDGTRVRAHRFEWMIIAGNDMEKAVHHMNYKTRKHSWVETKNGEVVEKKTEDIPEGINYDDILSAFYNFRNSVYGKLQKNSIYTIYTIPEKDHNTISVQIKGDAERKKVQKKEGRRHIRELLMDVIIPKEIFKTKNGRLMFWASQNYIPLETTVKNYIFLGDLHAKFSRRVYLPKKPPEKPPPRTQNIKS